MFFFLTVESHLRRREKREKVVDGEDSGWGFYKMKVF